MFGWLRVQPLTLPTDLEQFQRSLESARRGEEVAIMFNRWARDSPPQDVRLFRVPTFGHAEPGDIADGAGM